MNSNKIYKYSFWISLCVSIILICVGFALPPSGVVDGSVITSVGILFLYPTLALANKSMEEGKSIRISKGDAKIQVGNNSDESMDNGESEEGCE